MSRIIFIGNLNYDTTVDRLSDFLSPFGTLEKCEIIVDKYTFKSKGFAYAELDSPETADRIISNLNGKTLDGRTVKIEYYSK